MLAFIVGRALWVVVLAWVISVITFALFFALPPNQPGTNRQGLVAPNLSTQYNLHNKSLPAQYVIFVRRLVWHGDLGKSLRQPISVRAMIADALPVTASLVIGGTIFWLVLAFSIGLLSALRPRSLLDKGLMVLVLIGISIHPVALGLGLSYLLGFRLHAFPVGDYCDLHYHATSPCGGPRFWAYHMVLPWITFALLFAALYARMIRASMLEVLGEDYVRTAYAKGAGTRRVLWGHAFRNALLPVVAMLGMDVGLAFGGAVFIETAFQLPGMGQILYRALSANDLPVIMGVVLVVSLAVAILNMIADILCYALDPRSGIHGWRRRGLAASPWRPLARLRVRESSSP